MRLAVAALFVAGCGLQVVGTAAPEGDAGADAATAVLPSADAALPSDDAEGGAGDAGVDARVEAGSACPAGCAAWEVCDGACVDVASALKAFRYEIPCTNANRPACGNDPATDKTVTMKGAAGKTYDVVLRLRGVIEQRAYPGATSDPNATGMNHAFFAQGGDETNRNDTWNIYDLRIAQPAFTWHLNSGASGNLYSDAIDYQATIRVAASSTIVIHGDSVDGAMANNQGKDDPNEALVVTSVSATPYAGQYIQFDPVSVALVP